MRRLPDVGNQHDVEFTRGSWMALLTGAQKAALTPWQANKGTSQAASRTEISMTGGAAGIEALRKRAGELGLTISTQAAAGAMKFHDAMKTLWAVIRRAGFAIGEALAHALQKLAEDMTAAKVASGTGQCLHPEQPPACGDGAAGVTAAGLAMVGLASIGQTGRKSNRRIAVAGRHHPRPASAVDTGGLA